VQLLELGDDVVGGHNGLGFQEMSVAARLVI